MAPDTKPAVKPPKRIIGLILLLYAGACVLGNVGMLHLPLELPIWNPLGTFLTPTLTAGVTWPLNLLAATIINFGFAVVWIIGFGYVGFRLLVKGSVL